MESELENNNMTNTNNSAITAATVVSVPSVIGEVVPMPTLSSSLKALEASKVLLRKVEKEQKKAEASMKGAHGAGPMKFARERLARAKVAFRAASVSRDEALADVEAGRIRGFEFDKAFKAHERALKQTV